MSDLPPFLPGMSAIADRYDGLIVDLWGVIHNGERPYPGVVDCLHRLRRGGKRICLLSNAPRRIASVVARLGELGVPDNGYDHVLSSGELTHEALRERPDEFHRRLGARCLHIGPPRDNDVFEGVGLTMVARPDAADFVLCTGIDDFDETLDDYAPILQACAERRLPMVCANPDLIVVVGSKLAICAGELARLYAELGGPVAYHGKPYLEAYGRCMTLLGVDDPSRVVAIGDSLRTDIAGAVNAGIDSLLVTGGIHSQELGTDADGRPDPAKLAAAIEESGARPTATLPGMVW